MTERGGPQHIPRPQLWTPGAPPLWRHEDSGLITPEVLRDRFGGRIGAPSPVEAEGGSPSAVLIPIYPTDDGLEVVLTRRAWTLRTHQGEVSFPGGRAEPGEDPATTALREACEEVTLDAADVTVLGELDHLSTVTRRAYIVPVVALLEGRPELAASEAEVEQVLHVPLAELLHPEVYREEQWGRPPDSRPVHFFELYGDTVWGATAAMLRQFLLLSLGHDPGHRDTWDPAGSAGPWSPPPGYEGRVV